MFGDGGVGPPVAQTLSWHPEQDDVRTCMSVNPGYTYVGQGAAEQNSSRSCFNHPLNVISCVVIVGALAILGIDAVYMIRRVPEHEKPGAPHLQASLPPSTSVVAYPPQDELFDTTTQWLETTAPVAGEEYIDNDEQVFTPNPTSAPSTSILATTRLDESSINHPCRKICVIKKFGASCLARMQYSAKNTFSKDPKACERAEQRVTNECDFCSGCRLNSWFCGQLTTSRSPPTRAPHRQTTKEPFDCVTDAERFATAWSIPQKAFCCQHYGRGCPQMYSVPFNCYHMWDSWQTSWSHQKIAWCCEHEKRGCVDPSATAIVTGGTPFQN